MEQNCHRGHQSLDSNRGRQFDLPDSHSIWRQQQTPRGGGALVNPMPSPIWSPFPEEGRIWQQLDTDRIPTNYNTASNYTASNYTASNYTASNYTPTTYSASNYTTKAPSAEQISMLNSWASQAVGGGKYAYYLDRGGGQVTRLIPADMLPALSEIPKKETRSHGMEVLQSLNGVPPKGVADMNQHVSVKHVPRTTPKKDKVYCDKWVHEGICSFTQQGCRYKHVMPTDKATQQSLGLWHGFPPWWRKHLAEQRQQEAHANNMPDTPTPMRAKTWRKEEECSRSAMTGQGVMNGQGNGRQGRSGPADSIPPPYVLQNPLGVVEPPHQRRF